MSIFNKISSSFLLIKFLTLVKIFWISDFNLSLSSSTFSFINLISSIVSFIFNDKLSNNLILFCNFSIFSDLISLSGQIVQSVCCPYSSPLILVMHSEQQSLLWVLQKNFCSIKWLFSMHNPVNNSFSSLLNFKLILLWFWNNSEWNESHFLHIYILQSLQNIIASFSLWFIEEHFIFIFYI